MNDIHVLFLWILMYLQDCAWRFFVASLESWLIFTEHDCDLVYLEPFMWQLWDISQRSLVHLGECLNCWSQATLCYSCSILKAAAPIDLIIMLFHAFQFEWKEKANTVCSFQKCVTLIVIFNLLMLFWWQLPKVKHISQVKSTLNNVAKHSRCLYSLTLELLVWVGGSLTVTVA